MDVEADLAISERAAIAAGEIIALHYASEIVVETKTDGSPVTAADRAANEKILEILRAARPDDAILSEESVDDAGRLQSRRVWIVDPLDGTRDFVARTGDFSVHVGLAIDGVAVVGAVYQPVTKALFSAARGMGAWVQRQGARRRLQVSSTVDPAEVKVGVSRLNATSRTRQCLAASGLDRHVLAIGASVKLMALAEGTLDAVFNLSPGEQEWDTCAPEVVIREAGGVYSDGDGVAFQYNQPTPAHVRGSLATNGRCHAALLATMKPYLETDL